MSDRQGDLFSGGGFPAERDAPLGDERPAVAWSALDDKDLVAALLPDADIAGCLAITTEIGRRKLAEAIPALERLCQRFVGFGLDRIVPEQAAALDTLATLGDREAAQAVARLIVRRAVQGPGLKKAVGAAADLGSSLPSEVVLALLRRDDPEIRADACRCVGRRYSPETVQTVLELLEDLHAGVREAAGCALGRMGRREARELLIGLVRQKPSAEVVDAIAPIADEECIVLLGRLARENSGLSAAVLDALDAIDHPRAESVAAALRETAPRAECQN